MMEPLIDFNKYHTALESLDPIKANGKVTKVVGLVAEANGPASRIGTLCDIFPKGNKRAKNRI